jgi:hypothetical protein
VNHHGWVVLFMAGRRCHFFSERLAHPRRGWKPEFKEGRCPPLDGASCSPFCFMVSVSSEPHPETSADIGATGQMSRYRMALSIRYNCKPSWQRSPRCQRIENLNPTFRMCRSSE